MKKRFFYEQLKIKKLLLTMKMMLFISLFAVLNVMAVDSYSQNARLSLKANSISVEDVLFEIEEISDFYFLYNNKLIDVSRQVNVDFNNVKISEILSNLFEGEDIKYHVLEKQIILSPTNWDAVNLEQGLVVKGKVTDTDGNPLPGVNIIEKGTTNGTVTDIDGNYTVSVNSSDAVLSFSFIGFVTKEQEVGGSTTINISLAEEIQALDEVVVVGYGTMKKSDVTGATNRLTEDNMNKSVATSPLEMMQGRISGVNITQNSGEPGTGMTVRIRGSNSIRSGQEPLYVIDGIPLDNADLTPEGGNAAGYGGGSNKNPISFLNPDDIESIDILKDASSAAIYGARGANGVVLITTKKGKQGESNISYNGYMGFAQVREKLDLLTASEFRSYTKADGTKLLDLGASTDWQDEIFRTGITQSHNVSYSGGTEKFTYHTSLGYVDQEGIVDKTGQEKINAKIKVSQKSFNDRLNLTGSLFVSHIDDSRAPITENSGSGFEGDMIQSALKLNPTYPVYNEDGTYYQHAIDQRNPRAMLDLVDDITLTDRILSNVTATFNVIEGLDYKLNLAFDRTVAERRVNQDKELTYLSNDGEAYINGVSANNRLMENFVTYTKEIGDNSFNFLAGHAYQYIKVTTSELSVTGFEVEDIKYTDNLEYGNFSQADVNSSAYERELQSFFGRINYDYKSKYLLTFTGRYDGSSKFGENKKYGFFPSAAAAWRISEESFMQGINHLSYLKLRLGWGLTGNQEIPDKISLLSVGTEASANGYYNGSLSSGITFQRTPNPDIQWETTEQTNIGIDFGFLDQRISGTVDFFNKKTYDVLLELDAKTPAPTSTQWVNLEDLEILNKGVEIGLNGVLVNTNQLNWTVGVNLDFISNEVKNLPVQYIYTGYASGQGLSGTLVQIITEGESIGTFYGLVYEGFDSDGLAIYKTDGSGTEVKETLGSALPDFTYSFTTNLQYKGLDFSMFWYGSEGNMIYNNTANALFFKGPLNNGYNVTKDVYESDESPSNSNAFSSRFIEDGSFLRLSNVTLGYTIDTKSISWLSNARIYVTGNNLLLFTDYTGYDPEVDVDANSNGIPSLGIDFTQYPKPRTITLGVNLKF